MNIYKRFTYVKFCGCVREKYLRETTSGKTHSSKFVYKSKYYENTL